MTADSEAPATPSQSIDGTAGPDTATAAEQPDGADVRGDFQAALEAEVARRIEAVERRWQSRKDRELNRARRRWESETGRAIDPELLVWIAQADPQEVGQWLKAGLTPGHAPAAPAPSAAPEGQAAAASQDVSGAAAESGETGEGDSQPRSADARLEAATEPSGEPGDAQGTDDSSSEPDLEREAKVREHLAERRSLDPSPDLFPSRGAPADAFQQIEAAFARGEVDLETYEMARRRHGLR